MSFVKELLKNGISSAIEELFEKGRDTGAEQSRIAAEQRNKVLQAGPVITSRGIFHRAKQVSVEGEHGWKIEVLPDCPSPTTKFDEGLKNVYRTVNEAQQNRAKPCPYCYAEYPKNLVGML